LQILEGTAILNGGYSLKFVQKNEKIACVILSKKTVIVDIKRC
jgi:hypothetical protein